MIQKVSAGNSRMPAMNTKKNKAASMLKKGMDTVKTYTDSFVKHTKKSVPILFGMTIVWAIAGCNDKRPFKTAFKNNIKNFFVPVLLLSSVLLMILENKKPKKDTANQ